MHSRAHHADKLRQCLTYMFLKKQICSSFRGIRKQNPLLPTTKNIYQSHTRLHARVGYTLEVSITSGECDPFDRNVHVCSDEKQADGARQLLTFITSEAYLTN